MPAVSEMFRAFVSKKVDGNPLAHWKNYQDINEFFEANLSEREYEIMRNQGTEEAGESEYNKFSPSKGYFACKACGQALYTAESKELSYRQHPTFKKYIKGNVFRGESDKEKTQLECSKCRSHLGYAYFNTYDADKFCVKLPVKVEVPEKHCINGLSLKYVAASPL